MDVHVRSLLRKKDGSFTPVREWEGKLGRSEYLEGALELTVNGVPLITDQMWDYVDELWAYILGPLKVVTVTYFIGRHDASMKGYWHQVESLEEEREREISRFERNSSYVNFAFSVVESQASMMLAIDPEADQILTWDAWTTYMQVAEAMFALSVAPEGSTVERIIAREVRVLAAVAPGYFANAENWLKAFFLAVSCRDNERARSLCEISVDSIREWGESGFEEYDSYLYSWISAIQDLILQRPSFTDNLYAAMESTKYDAVRFQAAEYMDCVAFPQINSFYRFAEFNGNKFNEVFAQALLKFQEYSNRDETRKKSLPGVVPLGLLAIGCMAYDSSRALPGFDLEVKSGYLSKNVIERTWWDAYQI